MLRDKEANMTATAKRINPQEAYKHMQADSNTLLVCAYDSEEKFQQNHLEGAISLDEFISQADTLSKEQEIIFYCA
jgi:hypothetical protein